MFVRIARSARKHRIGNAHILAALDNSGEAVDVGDQRFCTWLDDRGIELELVLVPDNTGRATWVVIHAMPTEWRRGHG